MAARLIPGIPYSASTCRVRSCSASSPCSTIRITGKATLPTARDKYCERPDDLENLTIVGFTEQYEVFLRFEAIPVSRREDAVQDRTGRWVARRHKEVVARWQYLLPEDGERFYLQQLILKVPFRTTEFLSPHNASHTLQEECVLRGIVEQGEEAERDLKRQIESEYGIPGIRRAARKLVAKVLQGEDLDEVDGISENGERPGPRALAMDHFSSEISEAGMETEQLRKIWNPIVREMVAMNEKLKKKNKLTASQARILDHVTQRLTHREQILGAVTGPGGTGKSFLIAIIEAVATLEHQLNVVLLAPAGSPAFQLKGQTVHSFLKLDILLKCRLAPGTEAAEEVCQADLFIIDEMSMLSAELLEAFNRVVSDLSTAPGVPFGGKSVLLLGDFFQLPAIGGPPSYESVLFSRFAHFALIEIVRQEDDPEFAQVLAKVRLGTVDEEVTSFLQERVCGVGHELGEGCQYEKNPVAAVITSHRDERDAVNQRMLGAMPGRSVVLRALAQPSNIRVRETKDAMPRELEMKVNARVVVTRNLDISRGLVNGALGTVVDIQETLVSIRLDGRDEDDFIQRSKQKMEALDGGGDVWRHQFPLQLAWGLTVHRVQGMTLRTAHVMLNKNFFADGQAYVALSRVRKREDLHLLAFTPGAIRVNQEVLRRFGGEGLDRVDVAKAQQPEKPCAPPQGQPKWKKQDKQDKRGKQDKQDKQDKQQQQQELPPGVIRICRERGFPWAKNSCHFDSFVEGCLAAVLARGVLGPEWTLEYDVSGHILANAYTPTQLLKEALRIRNQSFLFSTEELIQIREAIRNQLNEIWGNGDLVSGKFGDPVEWVSHFHVPEAPDFGEIFGIRYVLRRTCPCRVQEVPQFRTLANLLPGPSFQEALRAFLLHDNHRDRPCPDCLLIPTKTAVGVHLPQVIFCTTLGPAVLGEEIEFYQGCYRIVAVIRHPPAHFVTYFWREGGLFFYDDYKPDEPEMGGYLHQIYPIPEGEMSSLRTALFLGRVD